MRIASVPGDGPWPARPILPARCRPGRASGIASGSDPGPLPPGRDGTGLVSLPRVARVRICHESERGVHGGEPRVTHRTTRPAGPRRAPGEPRGEPRRHGGARRTPPNSPNPGPLIDLASSHRGPIHRASARTGQVTWHLLSFALGVGSWCSGLTCQPVTLETAGSNPVEPALSLIHI